MRDANLPSIEEIEDTCWVWQNPAEDDRRLLRIATSPPLGQKVLQFEDIVIGEEIFSPTNHTIELHVVGTECPSGAKVINITDQFGDMSALLDSCLKLAGLQGPKLPLHSYDQRLQLG
jgi:hypothetical protein